MKNDKRQIEVNTLENYRVRIGEYDRWLAEFPDVCRVLENLKAQSEWHSGLRPVDISELRNELRNMRSGRTSAAAGASEGQAEPVAEMRVARDGRGNTRVTWKTLKWDTSDGLYQLYLHPSAELAALRERIAGIEKDAQRYRYLRNCGVIVDFTHAGPWKFTDDVDAAVDKLMSRSAAINAASASKTTERKKLCKGSHFMCEGREYCLGHPSCSDLAKESGK